MKKHQKFLEFNGKVINFLSSDGTYWIAIKPICEALKIDADRSIKTLKKDLIFGPERSIQAVQVSKNGVSQLRNMTCLPEKFIYGWIASLQSDSPELIKYKKTCYNLLYDHFHGTITNRKELLIERIAVDSEIHELREELRENDEKYQQLHDLINKRKLLSTQLNTQDKELVKQPGLFDGEQVGENDEI